MILPRNLEVLREDYCLDLMFPIGWNEWRNPLEEIGFDYWKDLNDEDVEEFSLMTEFDEVYSMLMLMLIDELICQFHRIIVQVMDMN